MIPARLPLALAGAATLLAHLAVFACMQASAAAPLGAGPTRTQQVTYVRTIEPVASIGAAALPVEPVVEHRPIPPRRPREAITRPLETLVTAQPAGAPAGAEYIDASRLSIRPRSIAPLAIPEPLVDGQQGVLTATLSLLIDADGNVNGIEVDESSLPPEFEELVRTVFEKARFYPGVFEGRSVHSRLRIEVGFDSGVAPE